MLLADDILSLLRNTVSDKSVTMEYGDKSDCKI